MSRQDAPPCAHCAQPSRAPVPLDETGARCWFCCPGCRAAYLLMRALTGGNA